MWGPTGIGRLFGSEMGTQISWLLPAALVFTAVVLWGTRRARRTDGRRAAVLIWATWLVVTGLVFSYAQGIIHPYYTVVLAPAIGALVGIGVAWTWERRRPCSPGSRSPVRLRAPRSGPTLYSTERRPGIRHSVTGWSRPVSPRRRSLRPARWYGAAAAPRAGRSCWPRSWRRSPHRPPTRCRRPRPSSPARFPPQAPRGRSRVLERGPAARAARSVGAAPERGHGEASGPSGSPVDRLRGRSAVPRRVLRVDPAGSGRARRRAGAASARPEVAHLAGSSSRVPRARRS